MVIRSNHSRVTADLPAFCGEFAGFAAPVVLLVGSSVGPPDMPLLGPPAGLFAGPTPRCWTIEGGFPLHGGVPSAIPGTGPSADPFPSSSIILRQLLLHNNLICPKKSGKFSPKSLY